MKRFRSIPLIVLCLLAAMFSGCSTLFPQAPTPTPSPTATLTSTPTAAPTNTLAPTKTPACNPDQTIMRLKLKFADLDMAVLYNTINGVSSLAVWFVDPDINPSAGAGELAENGKLAMRDALALAAKMSASDPCIGQLFQQINPIVVDTGYNGWFSGQISPRDLPGSDVTDEEALDARAEKFDIGFLRDKLTARAAVAPAGTCSWKEAKAGAKMHFAPTRQNIAFFLVQDDMGVNVWAQWDTKAEYLQYDLPASILNIAMEMECLHPQPDRIIFEIVDESGEMLFTGFWNWADAENQDLGRIYVLYQKE